MNLEFKFENEINATVRLGQKTVFAHTFDRYQDVHEVDVFDYTTDDDMVKVLDRVSKMVNLAQHDEVLNLIFKHLKGCYISYQKDGSMVIRKEDATAMYDVNGLMDNVKEFLEEYSFKLTGDFEDFGYNLIHLDDKCVATIYC